MQFLINRVVFILSPVKWGKMRVSKHHYAIELAAAGNTVYFIEPPDILLGEAFSKREIEGYKNLLLITYKPVARGKRFLPKVLYRQLLKLQISLLIKKISNKPDIVISFEPYRYENLKWFKAQKTIFFAADLFPKMLVPEEVKSADICLGVSPSIVELLKRNNYCSYFINHGLNDAFAQIAYKKLSHSRVEPSFTPTTFTVGYIGNLLIGSLDRETMKNIIEMHPEINYIFWGQYERGQDNMVAFEVEEVWDFINFLKSSKNVILKGPKGENELANDIKGVDLFWICYDINASWQVDGSNSHKILEYLATGKPVIGNYTATYETTELIYMLQQQDNSNYISLFNETLQIVKAGESEDLIRARINFALTKTYKKHIEFIDSLL